VNVPKAGPDAAPIGDGDPKPFAPPSNALLAPPPGQMASVNSYPFDDPAAKKAPLKQLKNTLETLNGFLTNEAPSLKDSVDPAVQLPIETAESDLRRLQDEIAVINKNPGIDGSLTIGDLNGINANLAFLQKKWRLSSNSVEGFQGGSPGSPGTGSPGTGSPGTGSPGTGSPGTGSPGTGSPGTGSPGTGSPRSAGTGSPGSPGTGSPSSPGTGSPAAGKITLAQLKTLQINISGFITQLQNSGTKSAIITQRINTLGFILGQVTDMLTKIETTKMKESEIPITLSDYKAFLPFVDINDPTTNMNNPLPKLLSATGASSALANLFPYYFNGDLSGAQLAQELFKKYASNLFTDVGYTVNVNMNKKSDSERKVTEELAKALARGTLGDNSNLAFSDTDNDGNSYGKAPASSVSGMFNNIIQSLTGVKDAKDAKGGSSGVTVKTAAGSAPAAPAHFDWKNRSQEICDQVTKRGLNAYDYGCLNNPEDVGDNFSYRGYAKMVCSRLETNYDPSIPGLCGCPPPTWPGWRP
jgi:hypothetical protein